MSLQKLIHNVTTKGRMLIWNCGCQHFMACVFYYLCNWSRIWIPSRSLFWFIRMFYSAKNWFIYVCSFDTNWLCQNLATTSLIYTSFMISQSFLSKLKTQYSRIDGVALDSENIFIANILKVVFYICKELSATNAFSHIQKENNSCQ